MGRVARVARVERVNTEIWEMKTRPLLPLTTRTLIDGTNYSTNDRQHNIYTLSRFIYTTLYRDISTLRQFSIYLIGLWCGGGCSMLDRKYFTIRYKYFTISYK